MREYELRNLSRLSRQEFTCREGYKPIIRFRTKHRPSVFYGVFLVVGGPRTIRERTNRVRSRHTLPPSTPVPPTSYPPISD